MMALYSEEMRAYSRS